MGVRNSQSVNKFGHIRSNVKQVRFCLVRLG